MRMYGTLVGYLPYHKVKQHSTTHPVATVDGFRWAELHGMIRVIENGGQDVRVDGSYCSDMAVHT